jgi:sarcosine oxidase
MRIESADVLVLGVGTMGSMACWRLACRGVAVVGLEQFEPGHDRGSGHGESRMLRTAYWEGPGYVPLVRSAIELWRQLEQETGTELLTMTGGLMIGRPEEDPVAGALRAAQEHDLPHQLLGREEMARRHPQHRLQEGEVGLWEPGAGVLPPETAIRAAAARAEELGARLHRQLRVTSIEVGDRVLVRAGDLAFAAPRLVVAVGPWLGRLLPELNLPLQVERQVMTWFRPGRPDDFAPQRFPVFIHRRDGVDAYGLPTLDGASVKVAIHHQGRSADPDRLDREVSEADVAPASRVVSGWLRGLDPRPVRASVCMYTNTPDEDFVVGAAPGLPGVVVLGGFSGHGFKFAPVIGEVAADLALEGRTRHPIAGFDPARFA